MGGVCLCVVINDRLAVIASSTSRTSSTSSSSRGSRYGVFGVSVYKAYDGASINVYLLDWDWVAGWDRTGRGRGVTYLVRTDSRERGEEKRRGKEREGECWLDGGII